MFQVRLWHCTTTDCTWDDNICEISVSRNEGPLLILLDQLFISILDECTIRLLNWACQSLYVQTRCMGTSQAQSVVLQTRAHKNWSLAKGSHPWLCFSSNIYSQIRTGIGKQLSITDHRIDKSVITISNSKRNHFSRKILEEGKKFYAGLNGLAMETGEFREYRWIFSEMDVLLSLSSLLRMLTHSYI